MSDEQMLLSDEERREIPKGFHFLLEYKEELDWLLNLQLAKATPLIREQVRLDINKMLEPTGLSIGTISEAGEIREYILCDKDGDEIPLAEFGESLKHED